VQPELLGCLGELAKRYTHPYQLISGQRRRGAHLETGARRGQGRRVDGVAQRTANAPAGR